MQWARPLGSGHVVRALREELGIGAIPCGHQRRRSRRARTGALQHGHEPSGRAARALARHARLPAGSRALTLDQLYLALGLSTRPSSARCSSGSVYFEVDDEDEQTRRWTPPRSRRSTPISGGRSPGMEARTSDFVGDPGMDFEGHSRELAKGLGHYIRPLGKEGQAGPGAVTDGIEGRAVRARADSRARSSPGRGSPARRPWTRRTRRSRR
jgi:hypothetical protein